MEKLYLATYSVYRNSSPCGTEEYEIYAETEEEARQQAEEYQDRLETSYGIKDPDNDYWCPLEELEKAED